MRSLCRLDEAQLDVALDELPETLPRLLFLAHVVKLLSLVPLKSKLLHAPHELLDRSVLILLEGSLVIQHTQCAIVHEDSSCLQVPVHTSKMYRTLEVAGLHVDLGSSLAQQPHNLRMTRRRGMMKRLLGVAGRRVDACLAVQEQVDDVLVALAGGPVERPHAREGVLLYAGPLVEQQLDHVVGPRRACIVKRVSSVSDLLAVQLRLGLQQHHADVAVVLPGCEVQHPLALRPERRVDVDAPLHETISEESSDHVRVPALDRLL
mmetsp:Transcript_5491/g.11169  ORF Transcript_5491/g.11169 Transcript_5491/m.11169 type:complete len:264 (-) Transcript_5491:489-1280(-)